MTIIINVKIMKSAETLMDRICVTVMMDTLTTELNLETA